ncbi:MAG TPA: hypothetical protein ENJ51_01920 [Leucothrix mucor]|uniref:Uncharacterized protein n=1 Tax=Leucothrix mucor TaxID=45248 RepID=A0A7V2WU99_LEUMU|nr:hypothetical protein [Leucothrix mucor]
MLSIRLYIILFLVIFPISAYPDNDKEISTRINSVKSVIDTSWEEKLKPLAEVAGEKWASLMTSTTVNSEKLKEAFSETWNLVLKDTKATKEVGDVGTAISNFISNEMSDTAESASHSAKLIKDDKLVDGIWYLSKHLAIDTNDNLAKAVQQSELLNTLGKITATSYGGPQGAAAYASWYAFKETNNPEMALKMGIMSGASNAGFSPIESESLSQLVKQNIISGVMAGLSAAIAGEDEKNIKKVFLNSIYQLPIDNIDTEKDNSFTPLNPID